MKNVKIYSISINPNIMQRVDDISSECAKEGINITRSKIINTLLESGTNPDSCYSWVKYFLAEWEFKESQKLIKR